MVLSALVPYLRLSYWIESRCYVTVKGECKTGICLMCFLLKHHRDAERGVGLSRWQTSAIHLARSPPSDLHMMRHSWQHLLRYSGGRRRPSRQEYVHPS